MSTTNNAAGIVRPIDITSTMQEAYLDYAMSVIVARALPDVRDGLKPVHRRILYAMYHDLNLVHDRPHKKSARIVGEVLGKYHPHGDTAVYDAMVRMAQDFSLRYPLVDGQGNFGSVDGDNAAAMRYTEARLAEISGLMLTDLEKDTVEWHDNFDNSLREPDILPAALPNLLINGASGIAVGMATNIPPHNLDEVVDALIYMIDRYDHLEDVTVEHLLDFVKGPDFPTGGILYRFREEKNSDEIDVVAQGYSVGKARMILQAKAHFEEMSRNRSRIVVTELPYQTNKTALIERIANLVRDGKIEGITDLRDESDRTGMRIVIELTRNVDPKAILADLFKYTPLQQTFGMQMLALVDGQPVLLGLKRMLHLFIQHREEIIRRRSEFELKRARARAHILEGLLKALDILDEVIATIRKSQRVDTARTNLMREFGFTQIQAQAILDMQLRRLAALERKRLQDEYKDLKKFITYLEDLLAHPDKILALIKEDLIAIKETYGNPRRTQIVDRTKGTLTSTDLLPEQDVWVSVMGNGELKRADVGKLTKTSAQSKAKISQAALLQANTRDYLYLFASDGRSARVAIHETPRDRRKHLSEFTDFTRRDDILAAIALPRIDADGSEGYLFFVTEMGIVKRVTMADFLTAAPSEPRVMNVDNNDRLAHAFVTQGDQEVILVSEGGKSIRFGETDVRSMGLAAAGVGGMKLKKGERIVYAGVVDADGELMTATEKGFVKRSALTDYSRQGRNGGGIVTHKPSSRTGKVSAATVLTAAELAEPGNWIAVVTAKGQAVMLTVSEVPQMGRGVQGKQLAQIGVGDRPCAIRVVAEWSNGNGAGDASAQNGDAASSSNGAKPAGAREKRSAAKKTVAASATVGRKTSTRKAKATKKPEQATLNLKVPAADTKTTGPRRSTKPANVKASKPKSATKSTTRSKPSSTTAQTAAKSAASGKRTSRASKAKTSKASPAPTKKSAASRSKRTNARSSASTQSTSGRGTSQTSKRGTAKSAKGSTSAKSGSSSTSRTKKSAASKSKQSRSTAKHSTSASGANKASIPGTSKAGSTSAKPTTKKPTTKKKPAGKQTSSAKTKGGKTVSSKKTAAPKKPNKLQTVTTVSKKQSGSGKT